MALAEVGGTNPATGAYKYYAHDNIQSTRGLYEQNKSIAGTLEYTPYGENYTSPAPASLTHRFTGLDLDTFTGQYYAPYRYYAPNLSRWLTRDPLGMVDGPNVYAYVRGNSLNAMDSLGLNPLVLFITLMMIALIVVLAGLVKAVCDLWPGKMCCYAVCGVSAGVACGLIGLATGAGGILCAWLAVFACMVICESIYGDEIPEGGGC